MTRTENFIIELNGKEYRCQSEITVGEVITQKIFVEGVGSHDDSHPYEPDQIESMMSAARRIAGEIIEESRLVEEPLDSTT
jgi:hypothetical protein